MKEFYAKECDLCDCRMLLKISERKGKEVVRCLDCKSVFEIYDNHPKFYISNKVLKNRNRMIF